MTTETRTYDSSLIGSLRRKGMKLTAAARRRIPTTQFALPNRRYPIEDASHARNALSRVSQYGTPAEKARVRKKVHAKYPGIGGKGRMSNHLTRLRSSGYFQPSTSRPGKKHPSGATYGAGVD